MEHLYWNNWYSGWGWFLWYGLIILMFSSVGNWGYTYRVHRRYGDETRKTALDLLNERYARGEMQRDEYNRIKYEIRSVTQNPPAQSGPKKHTFSRQNSPA